MDMQNAYMDNSATRRVAATVRQAMETRGVSQLGLSEATLIPRATLIRRLQGQSPFTITELDAIAGVLGTTISDLLGDGEAVAS